jgi:hypothetical protein
MLTVTSCVWLWNGDKGNWHFLTVPQEAAADLRRRGFAEQGGFGSLRVEAAIGELRWRTSLFPVKRTGEYLLPIKAKVRRDAGIVTGDQVTVTLELAGYPGGGDGSK